jgi:hypothetical protein
MIPIHVCTLTPPFSEPADPVYYALAGNGLFLVNKTALYRSITPVPVAGLAHCAPMLELSLPRVPGRIMERLYGFALAVYERWNGGEAMAFLHYAPGSQTYRLVVPPQVLHRTRISGHWRTARRVNYEGVPRADGFVALGDAHSHGDMPAAFSCTDDADDTQDGLRIVLGRLHRRPPDVAVSFVANRVRFLLPADRVVEEFRTPLTPPQAWLRRVRLDRHDREGVSAGHGQCR